MAHHEQICGFTPYTQSIHRVEGTTVFMAPTDQGDRLVVIGGALGFVGEREHREDKECLVAPLSHENAQRLRQVFPFTAPRPGLPGGCSMGVGDRLGVATAGHLRVFKRYPQVFPVLAQQSIRELNLTQRSYEEVLDCATFAVFKAGYQGGFGADGDHLKKPEEIEYALRCGYSMITLDCSEHIRGDAADLDHDALAARYQPDPELEAIYLNREIAIAPGITLTFDRDSFMRTVLIYGEAIGFMRDIYARYVEGKPVDFEISIDETMTPTTPLQHYFVANELVRHGVHFASLAPRFCGEFQKGIDYIGDVEQFSRELAVHDAIAKKFGYKVSVHSGSDKFKVFPAVGELTDGVFHIKTAGTNWLEAVRLVAMKDPAFYRELHAFALNSFPEATTYYHVTTDLGRIPEVHTLSDEQLPELMNHNDARQLLHITYGLILTAKDEHGNRALRDRLYALLDRYADDYAALLDKHIGHHLELLFSSK
ncbi:MAG: hypothetical protein GX653_02660 [Clostridiales bacterium]|nr:hypothetical protein [Clostridiales bacterium]